jgi:hypothetical protein
MRPSSAAADAHPRLGTRDPALRSRPVRPGGHRDRGQQPPPPLGDADLAHRYPGDCPQHPSRREVSRGARFNRLASRPLSEYHYRPPGPPSQTTLRAHACAPRPADPEATEQTPRLKRQPWRLAPVNLDGCLQIARKISLLTSLLKRLSLPAETGDPSEGAHDHRSAGAIVARIVGGICMILLTLARSGQFRASSC